MHSSVLSWSFTAWKHSANRLHPNVVLITMLSLNFNIAWIPLQIIDVMPIIYPPLPKGPLLVAVLWDLRLEHYKSWFDMYQHLQSFFSSLQQMFKMWSLSNWRQNASLLYSNFVFFLADSFVGAFAQTRSLVMLLKFYKVWYITALSTCFLCPGLT